MAKIVDLKQGTGNVFPRTVGEAVAVGGKLLTEAISNLYEKVSTVNDFISGEPAGTVNVAPNATNIVIGNDKKSNLSIGTNNSFYVDYKGKVTIGANSNKIEVDPEYDTIKIGNQAASTNLISITRDGLQIGHYYNSIKIGSDYSISIGTYNGIDIDYSGGIWIGSNMTNDVIIGTTYNNIKLGSDCSITIGTYDAIKIDPFGKVFIGGLNDITIGNQNAIKIGSDGKVTFGPNSGVSIGGGGGGSSDLDINMSSGVAMDIGWQTPDISIGTKRTTILDFCGKQISIMNDQERMTSFISMSTANGIIMKNNKSFDVWAPSINLGTSDVSNVNIKGTTAKIEANSIEINSIESFMVDDFKIITDSTTDTITFLNTLTGRSITLQLTDHPTTDTTGTTGSTGLTSGTSEMTSGTT